MCIYIYIFCVRDSTGQNRFRVVPIRSSSLFTKLLIIARVHLALATMRSACMVHPPLGIDRPVQSSPTPLSLSLSFRFETRYNTYILSSLPPLSTYYLRHSFATPVQLPVRQILTSLFHGYRSKLGKSILSTPIDQFGRKVLYYITDLSTDIVK